MLRTNIAIEIIEVNHQNRDSACPIIAFVATSCNKKRNHNNYKRYLSAAHFTEY